MIVVFAIGGLVSNSGTPVTQTTKVSVPTEAKSALEDASKLADENANRYRSYLSEPDKTGSQSSSSSATQGQRSTLINEGLTRISTDLKDLEASGTGWNGYAQAKTAMENVQEVLNYEQQMLEAQKAASNSTTDRGYQAAIDTFENLKEGYSSVAAPAFLKGYIDNTLEMLPIIQAGVVYSADGTTSTLSQYTFTELLQWWMTKQTAYDDQQDKALIHQMEASRDMLADLDSDTLKSGAPTIEIESVDTIAPNLYPSLDSATNIDVVAYDGKQSIMVSAEVVGFTQPFEQKYDLSQGYNYLQVKPSLLPSNQMTNLDSNSATHLNVKVTDADTGKVLAQESKEIDLLSMYDFTWENSDFGSTAFFDVLAWLRPQADEVNEVNRLAASYMSKWTNGQVSSIAGYQYNNDWSMTLLQVAAIQAAISEKGVLYVMDPYSFTANQHIFTPDKVVQKQQGICIETSLLMASCLMSANMHPMIILTPGHAQIAVEAYPGSGSYFLIETTNLPYDGVNTSYKVTEGAFWNGLLASAKASDGSIYIWTKNGSSEEWQTYLDYKKDGSDEFGGVFVIDCNLQKILGIQGVENL